jgi:hypothetical protein
MSRDSSFYKWLPTVWEVRVRFPDWGRFRHYVHNGCGIYLAFSLMGAKILRCVKHDA